MSFANYQRKASTALLWVIFGFFMILFLATMFDVGYVLAQPLIRDERPEEADVIIVLGGGVVTSTRSLPWSVQERVQRGWELYQQGYADHIIVTGGRVESRPYTESMVMTDYLTEQLGAPVSAIHQEREATSTYENAVFAIPIMMRHGWSSALVVTSDYHTGRACAVFEQVGYDVACSAAYRKPTGGGLYRNYINFRSTLREYAATIYYYFSGVL